MALSIRRRTVEEKARRYAAIRGTTVTAAIEEALDRQLERHDDEREARAREFIRAVRKIQAEVAKLPILDDRPIDEIVGYDENGLPA